jgi:hypothetical protein
MDYPYGVVTLYASSTFGRRIREMCGEYHPENSDNRWYLPVDSVNVPVNITSQTKATYPEIRVHPFFDEEDSYAGFGYGYSSGDAGYGEDPSIQYIRARSDLSIRTIRSHIDIFDKSLSGVTKIRDALVERLLKFKIAQCRLIKELEEDMWIQDEDDENIYKNANFNSQSSIVSVYDESTKLLNTEDVGDNEGSWFINDNEMVVYPLTNPDNLQMKELVTNGLVFSDGSMLFEGGFLKFQIVRSQPQKTGNPHLHHWIIHTISDYKEMISQEYNKTYAEVDVDDG